MLVWSDWRSLLDFLVAAGKVDTWRGEHYVELVAAEGEDLSLAMKTVADEMEAASVWLRLDSKLFFIVRSMGDDGEKARVYEIYGRSASSLNVSLAYYQSKLSLWKIKTLTFLVWL